jgi:hypothetical protein
VRDYDPDVLVLRPRTKCDLLVRQLFLQPVVLLLKLLVLEIQADAVVLILREEHAVVDVGSLHPTQVDTLLRVTLDLGHRASGGIKQIQFGQVQ